MRTTLDIPDELYRSLKARAAMQGRTVREVAVNLFSNWVQEGTNPAEKEDRDSATEIDAWLFRLEALGQAMERRSADPRSAVEILLDDRR
jgi:plasmid stability protein